MKVYISADMEGITGLVDAEDVQPHGRDYEHGRVMMTEDVNAAVRGALTAGAIAVVVNDAHKPMRNLLPDRLHPVARLVRGGPKPMGMLEGLDGSFDAAVCIGFHARAGTFGVLSHSFMGHEIEDIWLDGRRVGEIGLLHATAAAMGVPVVMLSGDDAACAEMIDWDAEVATVAVKRTRDRFAAELDPVVEARERIEAAVGAAVRARPGGRCVPSAAEATTLAVRWQSTSVASHLLGIPGVTLRDGRTVEVTGPMTDVFRLFGVFMRVATALTGQPPYC
ncbi:MAG: D-amino peptidase [Streptosporangiaceae bacterium]|jgi:D-amino peptidase|nr:D-aminopeptidase [Streptosporangiaceae bacterium]MDX6433599.1 D-amino peptidase [Streptosporangiaceae bacterium]